MAFKLFPSFSFDESNVGPRPIRTASVDRIALVGTFERGPVSPQVVDATTAEQMFGFTNHVGSAHLQMMVAQGADSFLIKRVMARGARAYREVSLTGTVTTGGSIKVSLLYKANPTGSSVTNVVTVDLTKDSTAAQVRDGIVNQVNGSRDASGNVLPIRAIATPDGLLRFESRKAEDRLASVKIEPQTTAGITYDAQDTTEDITAVAVTLDGGKDEPTPAQSVLMNSSLEPVIHFEAVWPGTSGNNIVCLVRQGSIPGCFDFELSVEDSDGDINVERYKDVRIAKYGSAKIDLYDVDKLSAFKTSKMVRAQHVMPDLAVESGNERAFVEDYLEFDSANREMNTLLAFTTGDDGDNDIDTEDFLHAIDMLKDFQCTVVTCPGEKPVGVDQRAIQEKIKQHVVEMETVYGEALGLRVGVISSPRLSDLPTLQDQFSTGAVGDNKRIVYVTGWATSALLPRFKKYGIDPAAIYAAHLAVVAQVSGPHVSPAARTSAPSISGILEVDTPIGVVAQNEITRCRMEAIILDPVTRDFRMLNGRTTCSDGAWYWICVRRVYDKIRMDVFFNMQFIKSEPSSRMMDSVIENSINGYLANLLSGRIINGYDPAVSNDTNNPAAVRAMGIRYVDFGIEPVFPNDFVQFNINRVLTASVRLA